LENIEQKNLLPEIFLAQPIKIKLYFRPAYFIRKASMTCDYLEAFVARSICSISAVNFINMGVNSSWIYLNI
jgi:hypothetical protein